MAVIMWLCTASSFSRVEFSVDRLEGVQEIVFIEMVSELIIIINIMPISLVLRGVRKSGVAKMTIEGAKRPKMQNARELRLQVICENA